MPDDVVSAPIGEIRAASTAGGGSALTTTATFTSLPRDTNFVRLQPRNAVTAVVIQYALNPWLIVFKTTDDLISVANMTEYTQEAQDTDTATVVTMDSFNSIANGDALFVGSYVPFRGVQVTIGNTNSIGTSTLTVKYRKSDATWADISATDNTKSTDTFRQTGSVVWTMPTDWIARSILSIQELVGTWAAGDMDTTAGDLTLPDFNSLPTFIYDPQIFWTRWETNNVFDSTVTATAMQAMNRSTAYDELDVSVGMEMRVHRGSGGIGCIEHLVDAGTANLIISAGVLGSHGKFAD